MMSKDRKSLVHSSHRWARDADTCYASFSICSLLHKSFDDEISDDFDAAMGMCLQTANPNTACTHLVGYTHTLRIMRQHLEQHGFHLFS